MLLYILLSSTPAPTLSYFYNFIIFLRTILKVAKRKRLITRESIRKRWKMLSHTIFTLDMINQRLWRMFTRCALFCDTEQKKTWRNHKIMNNKKVTTQQTPSIQLVSYPQNFDIRLIYWSLKDSDSTTEKETLLRFCSCLLLQIFTITSKNLWIQTFTIMIVVVVKGTQDIRIKFLSNDLLLWMVTIVCVSCVLKPHLKRDHYSMKT